MRAVDLTPPERTITQRERALERADEVRLARAQLKRDIRARRLSAAAVLREPPEYLDTMKVWDLLMAAPRVGRVKVNKALTHCRIYQGKTIGGLSERQRGELVELLAGR